MVSLDQKAIRKYQKISKTIANPRLISQLRKLIPEEQHSLEELLNWLHIVLKWSKEDITRHNNPVDIMNYGKGRCGEFSILFMAACLAKGYRARIVLDMSDHVWTEVWSGKEDRWVHVDPLEKRIDDPHMYEREWKKNLDEIYAFENGDRENVTSRYKIKPEK